MNEFPPVPVSVATGARCYHCQHSGHKHCEHHHDLIQVAVAPGIYRWVTLRGFDRLLSLVNDGWDTNPNIDAPREGGAERAKRSEVPTDHTPQTYSVALILKRDGADPIDMSSATHFAYYGLNPQMMEDFDNALPAVAERLAQHLIRSRNEPYIVHTHSPGDLLA